jgi:hypothetical protein
MERLRLHDFASINQVQLPIDVAASHLIRFLGQPDDISRCVVWVAASQIYRNRPRQARPEPIHGPPEEDLAPP